MKPHESRGNLNFHIAAGDIVVGGTVGVGVGAVDGRFPKDAPAVGFVLRPVTPIGEHILQGVSSYVDAEMPGTEKFRRPCRRTGDGVGFFPDVETLSFTYGGRTGGARQVCGVGTHTPGEILAVGDPAETR